MVKKTDKKVATRTRSTSRTGRKPDDQPRDDQSARDLERVSELQQNEDRVAGVAPARRSDRLRAVAPVTYFPAPKPRRQYPPGGKNLNVEQGWQQGVAQYPPRRKPFPF